MHRLPSVRISKPPRLAPKLHLCGADPDQLEHGTTRRVGEAGGDIVGTTRSDGGAIDEAGFRCRFVCLFPVPKPVPVPVSKVLVRLLSGW